jgi:hypothetical protein
MSDSRARDRVKRKRGGIRLSCIAKDVCNMSTVDLLDLLQCQSPTHVAFAYCIYQKLLVPDISFSTAPSPIRPQSCHTLLVTNHPCRISLANRHPRHTLPSSVPEGGDRCGAEVDDATEVPRSAPSSAATVPGRDLLAQRLLLCTCSAPPSTHGGRAQEWRCWHARAEVRRRGAEEEGRHVALPSRERGRGSVIGVEADMDNRF